MGETGGFDDWVDYFHEWIRSIGVDCPEVREKKFETKFEQLATAEIEFGQYRGLPRWEEVEHIPSHRVQEALLHLIVYQGDTEFGSVEQHRKLLETSPGDEDRRALLRLLTDEMRHGWQIAHLLIAHFGEGGRSEARKLLERRAYKNNRLLNSFSQRVDHWLDFFFYTELVDRAGIYQTAMLGGSAFAPLARSIPPILLEEAFHQETGDNGLRRVLRAGKIPVPMVQRYMNKWASTAYDLFGTDRSSFAGLTYIWGLKGRFDESSDPEPADLRHLNEHARALFRQELNGLLESLNREIPEGQPQLSIPDIRFNRSIGDDVGSLYSAAGELLGSEDYEKHLREALPGPQDLETLGEIFKPNDWMAR